MYVRPNRSARAGSGSHSHEVAAGSDVVPQEVLLGREEARLGQDDDGEVGEERSRVGLSDEQRRARSR